jgi:4-hydroxy-3-methylbut-2-en-1-yl diphosphate synthase IspG/GcpE
MTSISATEKAEITLQFDRSRTVDSAAQDVQAAINAAAGQLPPTMPNPPIYRKTNPADTPVLMLALTSETLPLTTVSDYANSILAQKISQMPGVGLVGIGGQQSPAIRVRVNPALLAAEGLDLEAVRTALSTATVDQRGSATRSAFRSPPTRSREVKAGFEILKSLNLRCRGVTVISCPSCARQQFEVIKTVERLEERLAHITTPMTVSVIGCVVNGPGEARETDIGFTGGGNGTHQVYINGLTDHRLKNADIVDHLVELVEKKAAEIEAVKQREQESVLTVAQ